MAITSRPSVLATLGGQVSASEPDADLLARYVAERDEGVFAVLVRRYARLVWQVARTRCRTEATAEEVFQAAFVVLARKAGSIRSAAALPGWLHRTAHRLAVKAARRERPTAPLPADTAVSADPLDALSARELLAAVDDEMAKLSDAERSVLVLCGIENQSLDEAATRLGCSVGSVKGRLERARSKLRTRLTARGLTLPAVVIGLIAGPSARAVEVAVTLPGGPVPPPIEHLISGGTTMTRRFAALGLAAVLVAGGMGIGFGLVPQGGTSATAAPVPKALKKDHTAWGEELGGLQAGLRMPGGTTVRPGESAELQVVVRNVSQEPIQVTYTEQRAGWWFARFVNADGVVTGVPEFDTRYLAMSGFMVPMKPRVVTLKPGEEVVRWTVQVRHSPEDDKTPPGPHVHLPAGEYQFVMPRICGDMENEKRTGKAPAFDRLGTGTLEVVLPEPQLIKAPVPKEKGSAVLWSETVKVDWQASRAERLAGIWMPDGKSVLVPSPTLADRDEKLDFGGVDIRDADGGKVTKTLAYKNGKADQMFLPQSLAVTADGKTLHASGSVFAPGGKGEAARGLVTWRDTGKDDPPQVNTDAAPPDAPLVLSPDNKQLATLGPNGAVEARDTATGKLFWSSLPGGKGRVTALAFNAYDRSYLAGTTTGEWIACEARTGRILSTVSELGVGVRAAVATGDGTRFALGGKALANGQPLAVYGKETLNVTDAVPKNVAINGLTVSPDGKHLVAACSDGYVRVFEVDGGKLLAAAKEHKEAVFSVAYSPNGKKLLTVGKDAMKVWDVEALMKSK